MGLLEDTECADGDLMTAVETYDTTAPGLEVMMTVRI